MTNNNNVSKLSATQDRLISCYLDLYAEHEHAKAKLDSIRDEIKKFSDATGIVSFENAVAKAAIYDISGKATLDKGKVIELIGEDAYSACLKFGAPSVGVKVTIKKWQAA